MNFLNTAACTVLSVFVSSVALAEDESAILEKLYVDSGLEILIDYLPASVSQAIEAEKTTIAPEDRVPEEFWQLLLEKVADDFSPEQMKSVIFEDLRDGMTDEEINKNIDWVNTPLGKKTKRISETVYSVEGAANLEKCISELGVNPPSDLR